MNNGQVDRLPVNQLQERYNGLARSAVYARMEALGIKTEKVGNKAYVNAEQLALLDDLHHFLQSGRSTAEFLESRGLTPSGRSDNASSGLSGGLSTVPSDLARLAAFIASEVAAKYQAQPPSRDPLAYFDILERASQNGWLLSTSELCELLDLDPSELKRYGDRFAEAGFFFTQAGYRAGGEVAWKVSKPLR